ncbi:MAG: FHA domain-containing protein [Acidimicrobiales bacterium]
MSEQLLTILKFALLALLYLFFFRVVRAVWAEITPPKPGRASAEPAASTRPPSRRQARKAAKAAAVAAPVAVAAGPVATAPARAPAAATAAAQLVVDEPAGQRGRTYPVGDEVTVGRAAGCQITIDDTYVSQVHARVFRRDGQLYVEDLGSTNGTYLNRAKVTGPMVMQPGDQLQVGNTVMVLR